MGDSSFTSIESERELKLNADRRGAFLGVYTEYLLLTSKKKGEQR